MPRPPHKPVKPEDLPVLTELSDAGARIPVLTEVTERRAPPAPAAARAPLTDAQCVELAARLAPRLEAILREKFARHFEALWEKSWRETESSLPELIRDELTSRPRRSPK